MINSVTKLKNSLYGAGPNTANKKQVWRDAMDLLIDSTPQKLSTSTTIDFSNPFTYNGTEYYILNFPPLKVPADWKLQYWEWEISGLHPGYDRLTTGDGAIAAFFSSFDGPVNAENQLDNLDNYFIEGIENGDRSVILTNPLITNSPWVCTNGTYNVNQPVPSVEMPDAYICYQEDGSSSETMTAVYGHVFPNSWEDIGGNGYWMANMYHPLAKTDTAELSYFSTPKTIHTSVVFYENALDPVIKDAWGGETFTLKIDIQKYK